MYNRVGQLRTSNPIRLLRHLCCDVRYSHRPLLKKFESLTVQGRFRGLDVVPSCSYEGTSYSLVQSLLLKHPSIHPCLFAPRSKKTSNNTSYAIYAVWSMYHLATMHSVTDRPTNRQTDRHYEANNPSYCVQYDRLKTTVKNGKRLEHSRTNGDLSFWSTSV